VPRHSFTKFEFLWIDAVWVATQSHRLTRIWKCRIKSSDSHGKSSFGEGEKYLDLGIEGPIARTSNRAGDVAEGNIQVNDRAEESTGLNLR
jgi:hypothetical protein